MSKAHRNKNFIAELMGQRDQKEDKRNCIAEAVEGMIKKEVIIDSVVHI